MLNVTGASIGNTGDGQKCIIVHVDIVAPIPDGAIDGICAALRGIEIATPFVPGPGHPDYPGDNDAS